MGFDFKQIDEDQLKTVGFASPCDQVNQAEAVRLQVRDTISIREQQQALIAQRRKDVVASTPATPKELTFKGWQPKDPDRLSSTGPLSSGGGSGGVGKRREKTRDKVEGMTINTGMHDKEGVLGSKVSQDSRLQSLTAERTDESRVGCTTTGRYVWISDRYPAYHSSPSNRLFPPGSSHGSHQSYAHKERRRARA